jgi:flagellar hook-length control protein FliK
MLNLINPAANPLDAIMGLGLGTNSQGQAAAGGFAQLLGLFPQFQSLGQTGVNPLTATAPSTKSDLSAKAANSGIIAMMMPLSLAAGLGIPATPVAGSTGDSLAQPSGEPMGLVKGQLLSDDTGKGQTLYLKIQPDVISGSADKSASQMTTANPTDLNGMILPLNLRTVEQDGNRIIADGVLQTATGKEAPIRIKLELAGSLWGKNASDAGSAATPTATTGTGQLSQLLRDLRVTSVVIENMETQTPQVASTLLPGAAVKQSAGQNATPQPSFIELPQSGAGQMMPPVQAIAPSMPQSQDQTSDGFGQSSTEKDSSSPAVTSLSAKTDAAGLPFNAAASAPVSAPAPVVTANLSDQTQAVRFYDLDQKIGQLKRNPGQSIRIQLVPSNLGQMEVSIASYRGQVTVNLTVESEQARQAVEKNLTQLEHQLASSGVKVDQFQVTVNQPAKTLAFAQAEQAYQGSFGSRQGRGYQDSSRSQKLMQKFTPGGPSFETVMVNCLA